MTASDFYTVTNRSHLLDLIFGLMTLTSGFMHNFAIELPPSWYNEWWTSFECRRLREMIMAAKMELTKRVTVYFIDYQLQLRETSCAGQENEVFYANGGRFIEVKEDDNWYYDYDMIWIDRRRFFRYINNLEENYTDKMFWDYGSGWFENSPRLAALAWVPD